MYVHASPGPCYAHLTRCLRTLRATASQLNRCEARHPEVSFQTLLVAALGAREGLWSEQHVLVPTPSEEVPARDLMSGKHGKGGCYPTCCPLVHFSPKGASKMLRATGHARMVKAAGESARVSTAVGPIGSRNLRLNDETMVNETT